jgi:hypothetical protein
MRLIELTIRVLCEVRPRSIVDGAVLYCQTIDNQHSVFRAAREIIHRNLARKVLIQNSGPVSGYPGFSVWKSELEKIGIPGSRIDGINTAEMNSLNTLIESEAVIPYAVNKGLRSLYVVSAPFHQLRAFMTLVTVALRSYPDALIFSYPGYPLPWLEEVTHSQGIPLGARKDIIKAEFERIENYQRKGDLSSEADIIEYLNRRDGSFH